MPATRSGTCACPPPPSPGTKWTRRVPRPVLIGHAASLAPYRGYCRPRSRRGASSRPTARPRSARAPLHTPADSPAAGAWRLCVRASECSGARTAPRDQPLCEDKDRSSHSSELLRTKIVIRLSFLAPELPSGAGWRVSSARSRSASCGPWRPRGRVRLAVPPRLQRITHRGARQVRPVVAGELPCPMKLPCRHEWLQTQTNDTPPPPSRTDWTRLVPPPELTGHVSSPNQSANDPPPGGGVVGLVDDGGRARAAPWRAACARRPAARAVPGGGDTPLPGHAADGGALRAWHFSSREEQKWRASQLTGAPAVRAGARGAARPSAGLRRARLRVSAHNVPLARGQRRPCL